MKHFFVVLWIAVIGFTGCSTKQIIPQYSFQVNDKIGYIVDVEQYPRHTYTGTTIFTNGVKEYPYDWKVPAYIEINLKKKILAHGNYTLVDLQEQNISAGALAGMYEFGVFSRQYTLAPAKQPLYDKLKNEGIRAVIVIHGGETVMSVAYGGVVTLTDTAAGYGLYTRSMFGMDTYCVAPAFTSTIYLIDPVGLIRSKLSEGMPHPGYECIGGTVASKSFEEKNHFTTPKDFENITEAEFEPFKTKIMDYLDKMTTDLADYIK